MKVTFVVIGMMFLTTLSNTRADEITPLERFPRLDSSRASEIELVLQGLDVAQRKMALEEFARGFSGECAEKEGFQKLGATDVDVDALLSRQSVVSWDTNLSTAAEYSVNPSASAEYLAQSFRRVSAEANRFSTSQRMGFSCYDRFEEMDGEGVELRCCVAIKGGAMARSANPFDLKFFQGFPQGLY